MVYFDYMYLVFGYWVVISIYGFFYVLHYFPFSKKNDEKKIIRKKRKRKKKRKWKRKWKKKMKIDREKILWIKVFGIDVFAFYFTSCSKKLIFGGMFSYVWDSKGE